ncbi:MAG: ankyrin repeat domain-containing protein [Alphaproteobacteria bacterium]|nr:ankyrin repeat domain-containing protein [Alphaproteobacteria bacterium]
MKKTDEEFYNEHLLYHMRMSGRHELGNCLRPIKNGANIELTSLGRTTLLLATEKEDKDVVKELLKLGANIEAQDRKGKTALALACKTGNIDLVNILLAANANINTQDERGNTPLIQSMCNTAWRVASHLIQNGADINVKNNEGVTALMAAALHGKKDVIKDLISKGANIDGTDVNGTGALSSTPFISTETQNFIRQEHKKYIAATFREAANKGTTKRRKIIRPKLAKGLS